MDIDKIREARSLVEQMICYGDAPIGLAVVAQLLDEGLQGDDGDDEMVWIGPTPPQFGIVRPPA